MSKDKLREIIIKVIRECQLLSGEDEVDIDLNTCPIKNLPNFDSARGVEVTSLLEDEIGTEFENIKNLFVSETLPRRPLIIYEIVEILYKELET